MISESDRRILTKACGLEWHEDVSNIYHPCSCSCGVEFGEYGGELLPIHLFYSNPTFTTPDDWELVRVNVVVPHITINPSSFSNWICMRYSEYFDDSTEWILTMAPAECCQMVADFIKESHDLFPWVVEMEEEKK
jgi:hypothetical protein